MPSRNYRVPRSAWLHVTSLTLLFLLAFYARAASRNPGKSSPTTSHAPPSPAFLAAGESLIHLTPGAAREGKPAFATGAGAGTVEFRIVDAQTGEPLFCRMNVIGPDGNFYEPAPTTNVLAPWSLHKLGNRVTKGPFRYYGWFFYARGEGTVQVPAGKVRLECWHGFEYSPAVSEVLVKAGETTQVTIPLKRHVDMPARGWYSGDTHIHLNRRSLAADQRALDLAEAEDIRFAHILCMNDPRTYDPMMERQLDWHQNFGLGKVSERYRGAYGIASGQEYRSITYGHICYVGASRLVDSAGLKTNPNNWPLFAKTSEEVRGLGGYSFYAHGGYEQEIYADFPQQAVDGVELLQFAEYRGVGLPGWYHILNAGFRFPAVGASDYPYCRVLGDCRTYAHLPTGTPANFREWNKAIAAGRSFFTTGPLLDVTLNGKRPGDTLELPRGTHSLPMKIWLASPVTPVDTIECLSLGKVVARRTLTEQDRHGPLEWHPTISVDGPTWIAVRAYARAQGDREDTDAHTNPIYIHHAGRQPRNHDSVKWLIERLDRQIAVQAARNFPERPRVLAYYNKSRELLKQRLNSPPAR